ncbi:uncharacterized protein LOC143788937 isoform X4 [Ranitomeya variabilis]|uniref:uncharacterized protein LOC143788937 isoform X4 n=1 Tax=Ranitomeya variabilis TaxID=490064 RepID=UPI004057CACF
MCISFVENWSSNLYITSPQLSILCLRTRDKFLTILCNSQRKMRIPAPGMAAGLGICPHRSRRPSQYLPPSKIFYDMVPFKKKLDRLLTSAKHNNVLDNKEFKFLTTASPIAPTLYLLPKIHKSTQEPPGRPIVAGIGGLYERPCIYLDHFLQPLVIHLGSSIQDTSHLIRQLQDLTVPDNTILVTMAVTSLYTCIGHTLGIEAVSDFLNQQITASPSMTSVDFLDLKVIKAGNRIQTKIFRKTTAANNLLHFSCFHPRHLRNNLPKGQFLRGRRKPGNTPTADQGTWFTY